MTTQFISSNPDFFRLLQALELFTQTSGKPSTEVDLQAAIGALAVVMNLMDKDPPIYQMAVDYQKLERSSGLIETTNHSALENIVQKARDRLTQNEVTLILLLRTYLQRVSSKLSAVEFFELTKAAIALLDHDQPETQLSLPERKRLLYKALQTFGTQLSQPIPTLGEKIPKQIAELIVHLVRYRKIICTDGVKAVFAKLVAQSSQNKFQQLSPSLIRTALKNDNVTLAPDLDTQGSLDDFAKILLFERQLQTPPPKTTKSEQEIAEQMNQAIAEFKAKYQPLANVTEPRWDSKLSVSSPFFTFNNFETASKDFNWLPESDTEETLKDETNS